jgi:hypothetical protein
MIRTKLLRRPFKIAADNARRYAPHYNIPTESSLVVPIKILGDEVSCDIRWEDERGVLNLLEDKVFVIANLERITAISDPKLHELWEHYYKRVETTKDF